MKIKNILCDVYKCKTRFIKKQSGFDRLFQSSNVKELHIQKWQFIEELGKIGLIILTLLLFFNFFDFLTSAHSEYLNSLLILPLLYSLRNIKDAFDSLFVKAYIADNYITVRRGFFSTKYDKLYITEVNNIEYYRSLGGKICGYGELDFYAFGGMLSLPYLKDDKHNLQIIREIVKIVNKNQNKIATS